VYEHRAKGNKDVHEGLSGRLCMDCCLVGEWTGWGHCVNDGTDERTRGNGGNDGHGGHGNRQVRVRMLVELKAAQEARV
jgi:hypothetical protein